MVIKWVRGHTPKTRDQWKSMEGRFEAYSHSKGYYLADNLENTIQHYPALTAAKHAAANAARDDHTVGHLNQDPPPRTEDP